MSWLSRKNDECVTFQVCEALCRYYCAVGWVLIARVYNKCELRFSPRAQLLLCNDRFREHDPRVNATLPLRSKMSILRYLKPVTGNSLPTPDEARPSASITKEVNQSVERAIADNRHAPIIAMHRTMARKANTIGKYAAENGKAAAIKSFKASLDIRESIMRLFKKSYQLRTRIKQLV